jgi:hypothetical protein
MLWCILLLKHIIWYSCQNFFFTVSDTAMVISQQHLWFMFSGITRRTLGGQSYNVSWSSWRRSALPCQLSPHKRPLFAYRQALIQENCSNKTHSHLSATIHWDFLITVVWVTMPCIVTSATYVYKKTRCIHPSIYPDWGFSALFPQL